MSGRLLLMTPMHGRTSRRSGTRGPLPADEVTHLPFLVHSQTEVMMCFSAPDTEIETDAFGFVVTRLESAERTR